MVQHVYILQNDCHLTIQFWQWKMSPDIIKHPYWEPLLYVNSETLSWSAHWPNDSLVRQTAIHLFWALASFTGMIQTKCSFKETIQFWVFSVFGDKNWVLINYSVIISYILPRFRKRKIRVGFLAKKVPEICFVEQMKT